MPRTPSWRAVHLRGSSDLCDKCAAHGANLRASTSNTPIDASECERINKVSLDEVSDEMDDEEKDGVGEGEKASAVTGAGEVGRSV